MDVAIQKSEEKKEVDRNRSKYLEKKFSVFEAKILYEQDAQVELFPIRKAVPLWPSGGCHWN